MNTIVLIVAIALAAVFLALILPEEHKVNTAVLKLGDPTYDIVPLTSPAAAGSMLSFLTAILTHTRIGLPLRRYLLKENRLDSIRDLAAQTKLPPLHFPMRRLSKDDRETIESHDCGESDPLCFQKVVEVGQQEHDSASDIKSSLDYHNAYLSGQTTPTKVAQRLLETVDAWERQGFIVFSSILREELLSEAAQSTQRYLDNKPLSVLDGVPVSFKDMLCIKGHVYYNGRDKNRWKEGKVCAEDDETVTNFRHYGALIVGLTVMVEGGVTPLGYNSHWKGPVSAYSASRYSGGSSSGCAVAVSTGLTPISVGFDGGGSVRVPATMSGVHGLATTFGRVLFNPEHLSSTLIKAGPIAINALDTALGYAVLAQTTSLNPTHHYNLMYDGGVKGVPAAHVKDWDQTQTLRGLRLGVFTPWVKDSDPVIFDRFNAVLSFLKGRGAEVVEISVPHLMTIAMAHAMKIATEFARSFEKDYAAKEQVLEHNTRITVAIGQSPTALEQLAGDVLRHWTFNHVTSLFKNLSLSAIVTPTLPIEVPILSEEAKVIGESNNVLSVQVMRYMSLVNFLGLPAYTVPVGGMSPSSFASAETETDKAELSLPIGFQLIGDHWTESTLLRIGHAIEEGFTKPLVRQSKAEGKKKLVPTSKFVFQPF